MENTNQNTIRVNVTIDATVDYMSFEARIFEYSWHDLPKLFDTDYFTELYKKALKRFSGYTDLSITVDAYTTHGFTSRYNGHIYGARTIVKFENVQRSEFINGSFCDFKPSDMKTVLADIKEAVKAANVYQIKK